MKHETDYWFSISSQGNTLNAAISTSNVLRAVVLILFYAAVPDQFTVKYHFVVFLFVFFFCIIFVLFNTNNRVSNDCCENDDRNNNYSNN